MKMEFTPSFSNLEIMNQSSKPITRREGCADSSSIEKSLPIEINLNVYPKIIQLSDNKNVNVIDERDKLSIRYNNQEYNHKKYKD